MKNNLIIVFYFKKSMLDKHGITFSITEIKKSLEPLIESSIEQFINHPKEILNKNIYDELILETYFQRKKKENKIKRSISIELINNEEYSILFNYNKFIGVDTQIDFSDISNKEITSFNKNEISIIEYINLVNEIIKYFKISIYENNMNFLMTHNINTLPYKLLKFIFIAKNLDCKIINY